MISTKIGVKKINKELATISAEDSTKNSVDIIEKVQQLMQKLHYLKKMQEELSKMKAGSVALVHQITTISKQRIYDPKNSNDILAKIKLSDSTMDTIDKKIQELFTKNVK